MDRSDFLRTLDRATYARLGVQSPVQSEQKMFQVFSLRLGCGPGVSGSQWIAHDVPLSVQVVREWANEGALVVGKLDDHGISLAGEHNSVLSVHNSAGLIRVFSDDYLQSMLWQDGVAV